MRASHIHSFMCHNYGNDVFFINLFFIERAIIVNATCVAG